MQVVWAVGLLLILLGLLGAAAVISVKATFGAIDATSLSHVDPGNAKKSVAQWVLASL